MTSETVTVVREWSEALASGDFERLSDTLDPDVVLYGTRGGLDEDRIVRGRDANLEYWREIKETWERLDATVERLFEAGDAVVVFWREIARSPHSDIEIQSDTAAVVEVRNGKIARVRGYMDREEALKSAGVSP